MDRILIATDLSVRSAHALRRGFMLASALGAHARVVSVVDDAIPEILVEGLVTGNTKEIRRKTADLVNELPCNYEIRVSAGDVAGVIVRQAAEFDAKLILLGLHRDRALIDSFRETTMERIARLSHIPVLLARNAAEGAYQNVLCAIDFSPASTAAAAVAGKIAGNANFTIFHAHQLIHHMRAEFPVNVGLFTQQAEAECRNWSEATPEVSALGKVDLIEGQFESILKKQVTRHKPDLLAVGAHSRPALVRYLFGSFVRDLIRNPPTDLLVCQP